MLQTSRLKLLGFSPCLHANSVHGEPFSHPLLSADELECLAQRISSVDGVTPGEARRQIAAFRSMVPAEGTVPTTQASE